MLVYYALGCIRARTLTPYLDIHRRTRSVYVHVPKTGGCTVKRIVYGLSSEVAGGHRPAWEYRLSDPVLFGDCFVFATVRHPLSRMRSAFRYLKAGAFNANSKQWSETHLAGFDTFDDFIRALAHNRALRRDIMCFRHFLPQSYFLCDRTGACIVDTLIRHERFAEDLRLICARMNVAYDDCWENVSERTNEGRWHDPDTERICFQLYRADYALLGYGIREPECEENLLTRPPSIAV